MRAPEYDEKLAAEYNADFDRVAFAVNRLLREIPEFRNIVHKEVGEQFDGDYNVLISQLVKNYDPVVEWFWQCEVDVHSIVEKYPLIQIAIPVEYEKWDGQEELPVVYIQYEFLDGETPYVHGYDKAGKLWKIDALNDPEVPVAVISMNERVLPGDPKDTDIPFAPQNLTATPMPDGILLKWGRPGNYYVMGYEIYKKVGNGNFEDYVYIQSSPSNTASTAIEQ